MLGFEMQIEGAEEWVTICAIIAALGGLILYFTVFADRKAGKYGRFMTKIYEFFRFNTLFITTLLKLVYLMLAIFITLSSFAMLEYDFWIFMAYLIGGNLLVRILFEFSLVILKIHENTSNINKKMNE